ncbi:MAG: MBL fold metallo-hydrolase [Eubacteriaceae bacterium]|nr:MBL fold metallo-hydrolase [Eubacteriaceae bacterium]
MNVKEFLLNNVKWFSQGCMRIDINGKVVYTDPFKVDGEYNDADLILLTHDHFDHFSPEDIKKVMTEKTTFILPFSMEDALDIFPKNPIACVYPDDVLNCEFCKVYAVNAYNIKNTQFHPLEKKWVGYVIEFDGISLYYTSDTELIPEMEDIECDAVFLPIDGYFTMPTMADVARAAVMTNAKYAVPIHYGTQEGAMDVVKEKIDLLHELLDGLCEVVCL